MIHYHGLPITPATAANKAIECGHAFVSYEYPDQLAIVAEVCQSFAVDNGAFSAWKRGITPNWEGYYDWAEECSMIPSCDFAVIPDVIDGSEAENDDLLAEWPFQHWFGAPVWHMGESMARLSRLIEAYPRICLGSSGDYSTIGTKEWWGQIDKAMKIICNDKGQPTVKLHGLRMLNPKVFTLLPFSSADSTNIGRNIGIDKKWKGTYLPPNKDMRAVIMRSRIEAYNSPIRYEFKGDGE